MHALFLKNPLWPAALIAIAAAAAPAAAVAQANAQPTPAPQVQRTDNKPINRTTSIPAKGLFVGDQLSESAKQQLTVLVIDAIGLDVEVALVVPTGPWVIDGAGNTERDLTDKRLGAVRKFLSDRGIDPKRIFVESKIDAKIKEPRLDVQLVGRPSTN